LGESLKGADKTVSRLKAAGFLLLPPCRGKVGMGVEISIVFMLGFYPLMKQLAIRLGEPTTLAKSLVIPSPPPARGRE